jgi:hypothetical protein
MDGPCHPAEKAAAQDKAISDDLQEKMEILLGTANR